MYTYFYSFKKRVYLGGLIIGISIIFILLSKFSYTYTTSYIITGTVTNTYATNLILDEHLTTNVYHALVSLSESSMKDYPLLPLSYNVRISKALYEQLYTGEELSFTLYCNFQKQIFSLTATPELLFFDIEVNTLF